MHIDQLVNSCKMILQLLKSLSLTDWGGHPRQMLQLYRSLVQSRIEYDCHVYASASPLVVIKRNTIQAIGLWIGFAALQAIQVEMVDIAALLQSIYILNSVLFRQLCMLVGIPES